MDLKISTYWLAAETVLKIVKSEYKTSICNQRNCCNIFKNLDKVEEALKQG